MEEAKNDGRGCQEMPSEVSVPTGSCSSVSLSTDGRKEKDQSSSPLQGSEQSSTSSTNSLTKWNAGDTGSSADMSDEALSSPEGSVSSPETPVQLAKCVSVEGNGNTCSASWMNNAGTEKEDNRAAFDRVVGDAPQRAHIRLRSRHHRGKGDKASDVSSDSSSYNRDSPPNVLNLSNIGVGKTQDGNLESEGSSGSGTFFRPTHNPAKRLLKHSKTKCDVSQSDNGIAACTCGSSTSQQSSMSVSRDSSGQDAADDSGVVTRKSASKRSLSMHYQTIKRCAQTDAETSNYSTVHLKAMPVAEPDMERERKRRRFNRTFGALRQCGLLDLTLQTATLMEQSQRMQKQLQTLRKETKTLLDAMLQFSQVQPNFLQTNNAQQVMTNLEEISKGGQDLATQRLLAEANESTAQLINGALKLQWHQKQPRLPARSEVQKNDLHPAPKKHKQKHSASSSQTLTSTTGSPTTDSDELQKQCNEIQKQLL